MGITLARLSFTAAMRMVDGIHDDATDVRSTAQPSAATRFTDADVLVIQIANLADRGHAGGQNTAHFPGLQPNLHVVAIAAHHLRKPSGTADQLATLPRFQFDI